jgi:hypothetical protein
MEYKRYRDSKGDIHWHITGEIGEDWVELEEPEFPMPDPNYQPPYEFQRRNEYPPIEDYIDGVVKGDQAQIDAYIAKCQAIKAKYPKPTT